jgi:hypothetical protein
MNTPTFNGFTSLFRMIKIILNVTVERWQTAQKKHKLFINETGGKNEG